MDEMGPLGAIFGAAPQQAHVVQFVDVPQQMVDAFDASDALTAITNHVRDGLDFLAPWTVGMAAADVSDVVNQFGESTSFQSSGFAYMVFSHLCLLRSLHCHRPKRGEY